MFDPFLSHEVWTPMFRCSNIEYVVPDPPQGVREHRVPALNHPSLNLEILESQILHCGSAILYSVIQRSQGNQRQLNKRRYRFLSFLLIVKHNKETVSLLFLSPLPHHFTKLRLQWRTWEHVAYTHFFLRSVGTTQWHWWSPSCKKGFCVTGPHPLCLTCCCYIEPFRENGKHLQTPGEVFQHGIWDSGF